MSETCAYGILENEAFIPVGDFSVKWERDGETEGGAPWWLELHGGGGGDEDTVWVLLTLW